MEGRAGEVAGLRGREDGAGLGDLVFVLLVREWTCQQGQPLGELFRELRQFTGHGLVCRGTCDTDRDTRHVGQQRAGELREELVSTPLADAEHIRTADVRPLRRSQRCPVPDEEVLAARGQALPLPVGHERAGHMGQVEHRVDTREEAPLEGCLQSWVTELLRDRVVGRPDESGPACLVPGHEAQQLGELTRSYGPGGQALEGLWPVDVQNSVARTCGRQVPGICDGPAPLREPAVEFAQVRVGSVVRRAGPRQDGRGPVGGRAAWGQDHVRMLAQAERGRSQDPRCRSDRLEPPVTVRRDDATPWADLLHAQAHQVLGAAGVPSLVLKGPSLSAWLYVDGARTYADADVLVPPGRREEALVALRTRGLEPSIPGLRLSEAGDHSVALRAPAPSGVELDLHTSFPGAEVSAQRFWEVCWDSRVPGSAAHRSVWFLGPSCRALLVALHAARDGYSALVSTQDLQQLLRTAEPDLWTSVFEMARALRAESALRAGLSLVSAGADVPTAAESGAEIGAEWRLRSRHGSGPHLVLLRLVNASWRERLRLLRDEAVPSAAFMRSAWPLARRGTIGLVAAHACRWLTLLAALPRLVRLVVEARRPQRRERATRSWRQRQD